MGDIAGGVGPAGTGRRAVTGAVTEVVGVARPDSQVDRRPEQGEGAGLPGAESAGGFREGELEVGRQIHQRGAPGRLGRRPRCEQRSSRELALDGREQVGLIPSRLRRQPTGVADVLPPTGSPG